VARHLYTGLFNILDYPAVVLPVGTIDPALDVKHPRESFFSDDDRESWEWCKFLRPLRQPLLIWLSRLAGAQPKLGLMRANRCPNAGR
jgi:hypothetical protein